MAGLYLFWILSLLVALRYVDPPTTGVQMQRQVEAMLSGRPYRKRYKFIPLDRISPNLQHAVISAEDGNLLQAPRDRLGASRVSRPAEPRNRQGSVAELPRSPSNW